MKKLVRLTIALGVALAALGVPAAAQKRQVEPIDVANPRTQEWPDEVVEAFARIPVLHRGRVKPMSTVAGFRMLNTNGKRKFEIVEGTKLPTAGEKLTPTEWFLDVMLFPEQARHYEIFVVNDSDALEAVGLRFENRKRRDRYSYAQLESARDKIEEEARRAGSKESRNRSRIEGQIYDLRNNMIEYEIVESTLSSLVTSIGSSPSERLLRTFPEGGNGAQFSSSSAIVHWDELKGWATEAEDQDAFSEEIRPLNNGLMAAIGRARFALATVPPAELENETWRTPGEVFEAAITPEITNPGASELELIDRFANVWLARGSVETAGPAILEASKAAEAAAEARGEFAKIPVEIGYYDRNFFTNALVFFLLGFLAIAFSWMAPTNRWVPLGSRVATILGAVYVIWGVTVRCLLLGRPPVATLYETILFITAIAVVVCLIAERMTKERMALGVGAALGAAGMFLASRYEVLEAGTQGDTMGGLVAVLNTNFWLATHVTTVTMGYAAGLLAAALGHVWLSMRLYTAFANKGPDMAPEKREWFRRFGRILYGVLCFGLLFSVIGTILGGVWANDSWGRFWGWDPKENGALMIVLYELVILHARMGGYIRDFGVALLSVVGGSIVAFSWWHVNHLGVGLHSYGFTSGIIETLTVYYVLVFAFTALSLIGWSIFLRPRRTVEAA
ncbi:MAG: cytochrome c biogenesis protein CcsA [Planctomycetota bacterium]